MLRSLKSKIIVASVLWTSGLLLLFHMGTLALIHGFPGAFRVDSPHVALLSALALLAIGFAIAWVSLERFRPLRDKLAKVQRGEAQHVEGEYPLEVQPLINDLNVLLTARQQAVSRALTTAADLAHGLKTPLALLAADAERAAELGQTELAESIAQHVDRISRQVDYHLARARATAFSASGAAPCAVAPCVDALIRTLAKLHAGKGLQLSSEVAAEIRVKVQREDLDEMLGNLLDNACKWARSRIIVRAEQAQGALAITVDDDGPGLDAALRTVVLERGVRLDEAAPGSGLGLAIVRDLSELYGGSITLEASPTGGLRAKLSLPAAT